MKLVDIDVNGADDQRFELEVTPDLQQQTSTNPSSLRRTKFPEVTVTGNRRLRFFTEPLPVKYGTSRCGADVTAVIFVNARQLRTILPDIVVGKEESRQFRCDGSSWDFAIELSLPPATLTFNFIIETACMDDG